MPCEGCGIWIYDDSLWASFRPGEPRICQPCARIWWLEDEVERLHDVNARSQRLDLAIRIGLVQEIERLGALNRWKDTIIEGALNRCAHPWFLLHGPSTPAPPPPPLPAAQGDPTPAGDGSTCISDAAFSPDSGSSAVGPLRPGGA